VAGSLKLGWTPASLLVTRLQAKPRESGLAKAIQEYGQHHRHERGQPRLYTE
jgi:TnpA family transposase